MPSGLASPSPASSQPSQARRQSTSVTCPACKEPTKSAQHGQHLLYCVCCNEPTHLACLTKIINDAGNEPPKNKIEWLHDFINFFSLVYQCKVCRDKYGAGPQCFDQTKIGANKEPDSAITNQLDEIRHKINNIDGQMQKIQGALQTLPNVETKVDKLQVELSLALPKLDDIGVCSSVDQPN